MEEYNVNPDFKIYVDKYCKSTGKTKEEAVKDRIVINVESEYRKRRLEGNI